MKRKLINIIATAAIALNAMLQPLTVLAEESDTVQLNKMHTYEEMCADINELKAQYSDKVTVGNIGTTALGKQIPYFTIGNLSS